VAAVAIGALGFIRGASQRRQLGMKSFSLITDCARDLPVWSSSVAIECGAILTPTPSIRCPSLTPSPLSPPARQTHFLPRSFWITRVSSQETHFFSRWCSMGMSIVLSYGKHWGRPRISRLQVLRLADSSDSLASAVPSLWTASEWIVSSMRARLCRL
jgi:hypothetical protein